MKNELVKEKKAVVIELTESGHRMLMRLLSRVDLKGSEAPEFLQVANAISNGKLMVRPIDESPSAS